MVKIVLRIVLVEVLLLCPRVLVEVSVANMCVDGVFMTVIVLLFMSVTTCVVVAVINVSTTYGYSTTVYTTGF